VFVAGPLHNITHLTAKRLYYQKPHINEEKAANTHRTSSTTSDSSYFSSGAATETQRANRRMGNWVRSPRALLRLVKPDPVCKVIIMSGHEIAEWFA